MDDEDACEAEYIHFIQNKIREYNWHFYQNQESAADCVEAKALCERFLRQAGDNVELLSELSTVIYAARVRVLGQGAFLLALHKAEQKLNPHVAFGFEVANALEGFTLAHWPDLEVRRVGERGHVERHG